MREEFGYDESAEVSSGVKEEMAIVKADEPTSRLLSRCRALTKDFQKFLAAFNDESWKQLKESSWTSPLGKMTTILTEGQKVGDKAVVSLATTWSTGLGALKQFCRACRDLSKAQLKDPKLMGMMDMTTKLRTFLKDDLEMTGLAP